MWKQTVLLLALLVAVHAQTWLHSNSTIRPVPHGGAFPTTATQNDSVISYLISTNNYVLDDKIAENSDLKVAARVFLGNQTYAGPAVEWTEETTHGDWTQVRTFRVVDPCDGLQKAGSTAFLLIDPFNMTLISDVAIRSSPLPILKSGIPHHGDASQCLSLTTPVAGDPLQCSQYFKFDFSDIPDSFNGFSISLSVKSDNSNALPFTRIYLASGESCPTKVKDKNWYSINFIPNTPGVTPTLLTFPGIANGTHLRSWWVMLDVPDQGVEASTPYSITLTHHVNPVLTPSTSPGPSSAPSKAPSHKPTPPPQRPSKPIPIWAVVIISLSCIFLATGALFWAWRLTRQKAPSNSYEFY